MLELPVSKVLASIIREKRRFGRKSLTQVATSLEKMLAVGRP